MFQFDLVKDEKKEGADVISREAVRALIYRNGKLLMVHSNRGDYKLPGGGVEPGETHEAALKREVREETGYGEITVGPCIGRVFEQNDDIEGTGACFRMQSYYYVCRLKSETAGKNDLDAYEKELEFTAVFAPVETFYERNLAILREEQKKLSHADGVIPEIPWLEREVMVLELIGGKKEKEDMAERMPDGIGQASDDGQTAPGFVSYLAPQIALEVFLCGEIIENAVREDGYISSKEGHANYVTIYDKKVQSELFARLRALVPDASFVGEEEDAAKTPEEQPGPGKVTFIIDPIDGTTNFIKDYKCSCISVGMTVDGIPALGIVYNPYLNELFLAIRGRGAYLNGKRIYVSKEPLSRGIVLFGTAPYYEELAEKSFEMAYEYFKKAMDVRRTGSAAIDLCNVACGRAELYYELRLYPWDFAAGALMVEEAGGRVSTPEGAPVTYDAPCAVLATGTLGEPA